MLTPIGGNSVHSSCLSVRTSVRNVNVSIAIYVFLAYVYRAEVMKPCGKNMAETQYEETCPCLTQILKNSNLLTRSVIQVPSGFNEGYATFSQFAGTLLSKKESNIFSSVMDITTKPLIAFLSSARVFLIVLTNLLNCKTS